MSRCFPFPPPGYEKKAKPDDENLLAKEKHKEKKHNKDKKDQDREKIEGKGRKDRDRGEEKKREKKDRKEKHEEKRDKHKDKEKKRTSDEKNIVEPQDGHDGDNKIGSNGTQTNEPKLLLELGKRIRDDDRATENHTVQKITLTNQNSAEVDTRGMENGSVKYFIGGDQRKVGVAGLVDKFVERRMEEREKKEHNSDGKADKKKEKDREKKRKSKDKKREKKDKEEKTKEKKSNKEQLKTRESGKTAVDVHNIKPLHILKESNKGNLNKRKENGFAHDNDMRPSKLPRIDSFSTQFVENARKIELCKTATQILPAREGSVDDHKVSNEASFSQPVAENGKKTELPSKPVLENGRRLEPYQTKTLLASGRQALVGNRKEDNKASLSCPVLENVKIMKTNQKATDLASVKQEAVDNHKADKTNHRTNGLINAPQQNVSSTRPSPAPLRAKKDVHQVLAKPPHPDSKYLNQILSLPNIERSGFDNQEWLFRSNDLKAKKLRLDSSPVEVEVDVWAEALWVESADVTVLPYVIPY